MSTFSRSPAPLLIVCVALTSLVQTPSHADENTLIWEGPRIGMSGGSPLGQEQKEKFEQYDFAALFRLPWGRQEWSSGVKFDTRLLATAGLLTAAVKTGMMTSVVPCLALSSRNEEISVDIGVGGGLFSTYRFGVQNFGGPFQIFATAGIGFRPYTHFHAGYRFQHFSDAGIYGPASLGVDMHILELSYTF
jgi:Lipid A 3-O-deacylase (PagL)